MEAIEEFKTVVLEQLKKKNYEVGEYGSIVVEIGDVRITLTNSSVLEKVWFGITTTTDDAEMVKLCRKIQEESNYQKKARIAQLEKELSELKK